MDAIPALTTEKAVKLFESFKVFTKAELESRQEIEYENYAKIINIESRTMSDMTNRMIIPAVIKFVSNVASSLNSVVSACPDANVSVQKELLLECSDLLSELKLANSKLAELTEEAMLIQDAKERAFAYKNKVTKAMESLRKPADKLETLVDKALWPMPDYGDLLFEI